MHCHLCFPRFLCCVEYLSVSLSKLVLTPLPGLWEIFTVLWAFQTVQSCPEFDSQNAKIMCLFSSTSWMQSQCGHKCWPSVWCLLVFNTLYFIQCLALTLITCKYLVFYQSKQKWGIRPPLISIQMIPMKLPLNSPLQVNSCTSNVTHLVTTIFRCLIAQEWVQMVMSLAALASPLCPDLSGDHGLLRSNRGHEVLLRQEVQRKLDQEATDFAQLLLSAAQVSLG